MSHHPASRSALSRPAARPSRRSRPEHFSASPAVSGRNRHKVTRKLGQPVNNVRSPKPSSRLLSPHRQKLLWAGGAITLLAMTTLLPTQVSSQAVAEANCEQVITSGAEISRGQLSSLLEMPTDTDKAAVRQAIAEPYCTLPALTPEGAAKETAKEAAKENKRNLDGNLDSNIVTEREAYPLAFDPEAWVVLNYQAGQYVGYDFVFKP